MVINSVAKALSLLELVNASGDSGVSLVELASQSGQKVPTVFNLLSTLEQSGFVYREPSSRRYVLGTSARQLGVWKTLPEEIACLAESDMKSLSESVRETVLLTVLVGHRRRTVLAYESLELLRVGAQCGEDGHLYSTATGRVMLSELSQGSLSELVSAVGEPGDAWPGAETAGGLEAALSMIRSSGYVDYRKAGGGSVRALAVPVRLSGTMMPAAVGMFYPLVRHEGDETAQAFLRQMSQCARRIESKWEKEHGRGDGFGRQG